MESLGTAGLIGVSLLVVVLVYLVFGRSNAPPKKQEQQEVKKKWVPPPPRNYTKEEVAQHNKRDDAWIIVDGKVYDITSYVDDHLGGDAILKYVGGDSSEGFHGDQHPVKVQEILDEFYIGDLVE